MEYGDRLWAKVETVHHRYKLGERHVYCKDCESSFYTKPDEDGNVNCWQCGAEVTLVMWFSGGPPAPASTEIVVIGTATVVVPGPVYGQHGDAR